MAMDILCIKESLSANIEDIKKTSKIILYLHGETHRTMDPKSIEFEPQKDDETDKFVNLLADELMLWGT